MKKILIISLMALPFLTFSTETSAMRSEDRQYWDQQFQPILNKLSALRKELENPKPPRTAAQIRAEIRGLEEQKMALTKRQHLEVWGTPLE